MSQFFRAKGKKCPFISIIKKKNVCFFKNTEETIMRLKKKSN